MKDGDVLLFRTKQGERFTTELAMTERKRKRGLSYRDRLPPKQGMFFLHTDEPQRRSMWMPHMRFPLDIVWLDGELKIVSIRKNVQPCANLNDCPSISSIYKSQHAIEFPAGEADDIGLRVGDRITFVRSL